MAWSCCLSVQPWRWVAAIALLGVVQGSSSKALRTPPMGWSSWNAFYCNIDEKTVQQQADLLSSLGLRDLGYDLVNVDDCWNNASRDASGNLQPSIGFKSGIPSLASYIHKQGFKLGLYTSQTSKTCAGRAGSFSHEAQDAATYCNWGVDYLKIDLCGGDHYQELNTSWIKFRQGFDKCTASRGGSPVIMSVEYCGLDHPGGPAGTDPVRGCGSWISKLADLWRTTSDLQPMWDSMYSTAKLNNAMATLTSPGQFNDPDMLQVGNFLFAEGNMNKAEMKTHYALWVIMAAPLILGHDLADFGAPGDKSRMSREEFLEIVANPEVIAVNQDSSVIQGTNRTADDAEAVGREVWAKPLADASVAVLLMNALPFPGFPVSTNTVTASQNVTVRWEQIGLHPGSEASVRDLWAGRDLGTFTGAFTTSVASHGHALLKITAGAAKTVI